MEALYVMTCGCVLKADERVRVKNKAYQCPNHPEGRFDYFIKHCVDCGVEINPKNTPVIRCGECQKIRVKELNRRAKHKYRYGVSIDDAEKAYEAHCNAWGCIHRKACIDDAEKSGRGGKYLPCLECDRYKRMDNAI